ncbi:MAG: permease [Candidatus Paceibacterales bacterium]
MLITTIVMAILSLIAFFIAYNKGKHLEGFVIAKDLTIQVLPLLIFAFILAGMFQVLIPTDLIAKWIGKESGLKGIFIGTIAGALLPGGPYVTLPVVVGLAKIGASIPVLVAMLTGWSLIALARLPMEIGIIGPKLALIRLASVVIFAPLAGLMAKLIIKVFNIN